MAAELLGVSEQTLRRWDKAGKLCPKRHPMNGYRLYAREAVLALKKQIEAEPEVRKAALQFAAVESSAGHVRVADEIRALIAKTVSISPASSCLELSASSCAVVGRRCRALQPNLEGAGY